MNIRAANSGDTDRIVDLLKQSLGESLIKKTAEVWNYKHLLNPFGPSIVLLAEEDGQLIGVRALMQWQWRRGDELLPAWRAVDTATHPKFQGRGVFKRLTLDALDIARSRNGQFVFNTPNDQSRPGYLKMGWQPMGKLRIALAPAWPIRWPGSKSKSLVSQAVDERGLQRLCNLHNDRLAASGQIFTPKSPEYLRWRYRDCPLQTYQIAVSDQFFVAATVRRRKWFGELRICEAISDDTKDARRQMRRVIKRWAAQHRCPIISAADRSLIPLSATGAFGPQFTLRPLADAIESGIARYRPQYWAYTLGDLELF